MTRPLEIGARDAAIRLDELYVRHRGLVAGVCRSLLRDPHEAEDASQQVFLSAYNSLLGGAVPRDTGAWIATIARNECRARIKKRMATPLPLELELESGGADPADLAGERAELADLKAALGRLPERQRAAVVLRDLLGLSYEEVSAAMDSTPPAVESLLSRGRSSLARQVRRAPELARRPVGLVFGVREAVERLLAALAPGSGDAVLAKLGAAAAVTVVAGTVALQPVVRGDAGPVRERRAPQAEVQTERPAPERRPDLTPASVRPVAGADVRVARRAPTAPPARPTSRVTRKAGAAPAVPAVPPARPPAAPAASPPPAADDGGYQGGGSGPEPDATGPGTSGGGGPGSGGSGSGGSGSDGSGSGTSGSGDSGSGSSGSGSGSSGSGSSGSGSSGSGSGSSGSGSGSSGSGSSGSGSGSGDSGSDSSGSGSSGSGSGSSGSGSSGSGSSGSGSSGSGSGDDEPPDSGDDGSPPVDDSGSGGSGSSGSGSSGSGSGSSGSGSGGSGSGSGGSGSGSGGSGSGDDDD